MISRQYNRLQAVALCFAGMGWFCHLYAGTNAHRLDVNEQVPEFTVVDIEGKEFHYPDAPNPVVLVAFYSPEKAQSKKTIEDIEYVLDKIETFPHPVVVLAVSDDPNAVYEMKVREKENLTIRHIKDSEFKLWGKFGVIASPTVFLADGEGTLKLIKAGHGYDFAPAVRSHLMAILGLADPADNPDTVAVKTLANNSATEKANRHLKMAQILEDKGSYQAALSQLEKAVQIDPNLLEVKIEMGRLYCVVADPNQAIALLRPLHPEDKRLQLQNALILGKAYAQRRDYTTAQTYLQSCLEMAPQNPEAYYEMGKIQEVLDQTDKAVLSYRKALDLLYKAPR